MINLLEHLKSRNLNVGLYDGVSLDHQEGVVTLPLWNLSGQMVGYQNYRPGADKKRKNHPREGRYYTFKGEQYPTAVWGLESYNYRNDVLVLTEGVFDACRLHNYGVPCVAVLASDTKLLRNWLTCTGRKVYKVDDDHASRLGKYENLNLPPGRADLGECESHEVQRMLEKLL